MSDFPAILQALQASLTSGPAKRGTDEHHAPRPQSHWIYNDQTWLELSPTSTLPSPPSSSPLNTTTLRLISWNIDILQPFAEERMAAALNHLSTLVTSTPADTPIVIFLQEMGRSDLAQIREEPWIQKGFMITEYDERNWPSPLYGTTVLVDRRLKVESVWRANWVSRFERDGCFVDLPLVSTSDTSGQNGKVLRLCNTHLESLIADPPVRPLQLEAAGKFLQEENVAAAILAGDLNAIQPFDRTLHVENGLEDAYLGLGGEEDSEEGYTWGYQPVSEGRDRFGCSRMDKILFRGDVKPTSFTRIGVDVKVDEKDRRRMREAGKEEWVTDHYGVMGDFELSGWTLAGSP